jgi:tetratricopeptide (TPR) repeat protein
MMNMNGSGRQYVPVFLLLLLGLAWLAYEPGVGGVFLLDDFQNLKTLERIQEPVTLQGVASVVFSNPSGDWGRGVAMLTFAAQHQSWPDDAAAFKQVNLLIHLLNGLLLYCLVWRLAEIGGLATARRRIAALFTCGIWLLHPMHVSTVLYAVQRMTELSALFLLAGLLAYLYGRQRAVDRPWRGYLTMTCGLAAGGVLAVFSKENGILLPLYVLALEATLLRDFAHPPHFDKWKAAVLWLPLAIGAAYLAIRYSSWILPGYAQRSYSPVERLMTEARVLSDYLGLLVLPRTGAFGLFHDDYVISRGLFDPVETLGAVMLVAGLLLTAFIWMKRYPIYSLAMLWFFGGHLLESTVIPLELYFEHRNYFPSIGLFIAAGLSLGRLASTGKWQNLRKWAGFAAAGWLLLLALMTWNESRLWGNPTLQAMVWAQQHPASERAQLQLAKARLAGGDYAGAADIYGKLAEAQPGAYAIWAQVYCLKPDAVPPVPYDKAMAALGKASFSRLAFSGLEQVVFAKENRSCDKLATPAVLGFIEALLDNPNYRTQHYHLLVLKGRLLVAQEDLPGGLASFDRAFALRANVELALLSVKALAQAGRLEETKVYLARAREANSRNGIARYSYEKDIEDWEKWLNSARMRHR